MVPNSKKSDLLEIFWKFLKIFNPPIFPDKLKNFTGRFLVQIRNEEQAMIPLQGMVGFR